MHISIFFIIRPPPTSTLFPYTTLFRSVLGVSRRRFEIVPSDSTRAAVWDGARRRSTNPGTEHLGAYHFRHPGPGDRGGDRKSTRLNSSHLGISYAVFCLKKKKKI